MAYVHDPDDITEDMTSNTTPSPNVTSASTELGAGYRAWNGFDHDAVNMWGTANPTSLPEWLQFDFGAGNSWIVTKYKLTGNFWEGPNSPGAWKFQGSNNGVDWVDLDTRSGQTWVAQETKTFNFSNSTAYRYYRLYVTAVYALNNILVVGELEMMGTAGGGGPQAYSYIM